MIARAASGSKPTRATVDSTEPESGRNPSMLENLFLVYRSKVCDCLEPFWNCFDAMKVCRASRIMYHMCVVPG